MRLRYFYGNELWHYGMKGQKWGVRRFQNTDGSLTPEGKERYSKSDTKTVKRGSLNITISLFGRNKNKGGGSSEKAPNNPKNQAYNHEFAGGYFEDRGVADMTDEEIDTLLKELGLDPNVKIGMNELNKLYKLYRNKENDQIKKLIAQNKKIVKNTHPSKVDDIKEAKRQIETLNNYLHTRNRNLNDKHNPLYYKSEYRQFKTKEWRDFLK